VINNKQITNGKSLAISNERLAMDLRLAMNDFVALRRNWKSVIATPSVMANRYSIIGFRGVS
jgi:hypothetical protein